MVSVERLEGERHPDCQSHPHPQAFPCNFMCFYSGFSLKRLISKRNEYHFRIKHIKLHGKSHLLIGTSIGIFPLMRPNNQAEACHRRLKSVIQCEHPSLSIFIQSFQKEENSIHCQILQLNAVHKSLQSKKIFR